ncbi:unnamed protein product, partial [Rotaria sp. Silwood2]
MFNICIDYKHNHTLLFYISSEWLSIRNISITKATSTLSFSTDDNNNQIRRADEYVMTSASIDGIKRSNVCGDGYRIEGALLKSYPYSKRESYLPYEDCYMTFKVCDFLCIIKIRMLSFVVLGSSI